MNMVAATQVEPAIRTVSPARALPPPRTEAGPGEGGASQTLSRFYWFLKALMPLFEDPEVEEIMVNGPDDIFFEKRGEMYRLDSVRVSPDAIRGAINVASKIARSSVGIGEKESPLVSAHIDDLRIAAAVQPVAEYSDCLCIRKHRRMQRSLQDYIDDGSFAFLRQKWKREVPQVRGTGLDSDVGTYFKDLMEQGATILVSGTPSGGKSTFVDTLVGLVPQKKRVVLIEDTHEINPKVPNRLCLIANAEAGVSMRDLVRFSLRARPDVLVIGEIRGAEAADFITAANSGPKALASIHADSALDALRKLEMLALQANEGIPFDAIRTQIASSVSVVVHWARHGRLRVPVSALRVLAYEKGQYVTEEIFSGS